MTAWNIITNLANGVGLERDYGIIKQELEAAGHVVSGVQFDSSGLVKQAHTNLFLETIVPDLFPMAGRNWLMPNPEWWNASLNPLLGKIDLVLCKTKDCQRIFQALCGTKTVFTGFAATDLYRSEVARNEAFLHVAGNSSLKNTEAILECWEKNSFKIPLTVVGRSMIASRAGRIAGVRHFARVGDGELVQLMNSHRYHLCPSMYEGYGHSLHESLGCRAIVITTSAPPMNEFGCPEELSVSPSHTGTHGLAALQIVNSEEIRRSVLRAVSLPERRKSEIEAAARKQFERGNEEFRSRFRELVA